MSTKKALPKILDNDTIFARIPLYHNITNGGHQMNDSIEITDFLILKNKVIYRRYGHKPYPSCHDINFYRFFSCQIFDVPDAIFDTLVIHELFEIIHFTSSNFSEIVYYRANEYKQCSPSGYKLYSPPPILESSDKTLYEFLFEINKKQKVVLSHKTCKWALADYIEQQYTMMEGYNKLNPMRSIYHYVSLVRDFNDYISFAEEERKQLKDAHLIESNIYVSKIEELTKKCLEIETDISTLDKLYQNKIKILEDDMQQLTNMHKIETNTYGSTIEELTKNAMI